MIKVGYTKLKFTLFLILLVFMPMHTLVFSYLLGSVKVLSLWRDIIILILVIMSIDHRIKKSFLDMSIIVIIAFILFYSIVSGEVSSLNIARTYIMPMLIYFYTRSGAFTDKELHMIVTACMITATLISIWGVIQAFILGPEIMFKFGYSNVGGRFTSTAFYINGWQQQRIIGTFSSPNACGAYFAFMIIILTRCRDIIKNRMLFLGCYLTILIGLLGTFSRSAWIGCVAGILLCNNKEKLSIKQLRIIVLVVLFFVFSFILFSRTGLFQKVYSMAIGHVGNTVSKNEGSFAYHITHLYEPAEVVLRKPLG